ncbi:beta-glucosidase 18 isoform X3 [Ziziphus jujuba]|uniref:Beta-glucosidase 18 isoform X3 n=1 Tax=Ziziphus jujuba TaxID=326968 RepID=A0ABM3I6Z6_ZIZJJ|nr:beta-glucosidase 18 isoform X3 [Ziziphus jujuba]
MIVGIIRKTSDSSVYTKTEVMRCQLCFFPFYLLFFFYSVDSSLAQISINEDEQQIQRSQFPEGFFFGTSTSSYQIEGAYLEDGKGLSNWDVFTHIPGKIRNNENGDVADDHYHRYMEDIEIMHSLGVNAYRFSISWARILPKGRFGKVNPKGIEFYNKIIDNLLLKGIEPFVALYHQDMPQILEESYGGWLNHLIQEDFLYLATICFNEFGDRVKHWITLNEPNHVAEFTYLRGELPPARCSPPFGNCSAGNSDVEPLVAMHNMLMAHAKVADMYHRHFKTTQGGLIGIIAFAFMYEPLRYEEVDREAVNRALAFNIAWMLDPLVYGKYPAEMHECLGLELPRFSNSDKELIRGSLDFIGINHYSTLYVKDCIYSACSMGGDRPVRGFLSTITERDGVPIGKPTAMPRFFVVPRGMKKIIEYLKQRYDNMPIFVTENGYSPKIQHDEHVEDLLQDVDRIKFHKAYLAALASAIRPWPSLIFSSTGVILDLFFWTVAVPQSHFQLYKSDFGSSQKQQPTQCNYYILPHAKKKKKKKKSNVIITCKLCGRDNS